MRVVSPKGSNVGYFKRNGILCTADILGGQLDLASTQTFDFFDDNADWQEAMNALDILENYEQAE